MLYKEMFHDVSILFVDIFNSSQQFVILCFYSVCYELRVPDWKYREWLASFEK